MARSGILGANGRPVTADRIEREKRDRFNPLENWTPDVLTRQLVQFAQGDLKSLAWVMDWLELHDDTTATVAPKAKAAVSRHGYDVVFADGLDRKLKRQAEDQREFLEGFYANLETGDAMEPDEAGGMRLLVQQVMDGYGKRYAAHHKIWMPGRDGTLKVRLVQVPLWFFENRTGRMRFLPSENAQHGVDLETMGGRGAWMISKGRGVMLACAIARMFKQIPMQDWLTYCDRHAMPAFLGRTDAKRGEEGWMQMMDAVKQLGAEFSGVVNTGDGIEVLQLGAQGELPYEKLVDRMERAMVMLWRGGDLSTISRANGVGSNPQQDETDELDADNAEWVSETLDAGLTKPAIAWKFGKDAACLVKLKLRTKIRVDLAKLNATVDSALAMGLRVSKDWYISVSGISEADEDEVALGEGDKGKEEALEEDEVDAVNTSPDTAKLFEGSLAKAVGISTEVLAPVRGVMERLAGGVQDGGMSDAEWLAGFEELALELPEFFDAQYAAEMAAELEGAMGTAVVNGVRQSLREEKEKL